MHEIFEDERSMILDFVGIPDTEYMETADSLRKIKDKIKVTLSVCVCFFCQQFTHFTAAYQCFDMHRIALLLQMCILCNNTFSVSQNVWVQLP